MSSGPSMTRRALIAAAVAATAGSVVRRLPGRAADGEAVLMGRMNTGPEATSIVRSSTGVSSGVTIGEPRWAIGARCDTPGSYSVRGTATSEGSVGVLGEADDVGGIGVRGDAAGSAATGVLGSSVTGTAVLADSDIGVGLRARAPRGVGAILAGQTPLRIMPSAIARTHPTSGRRGDLFVDVSGRLWFCKGGSNWRQIA